MRNWGLLTVLARQRCFIRNTGCFELLALLLLVGALALLLDVADSVLE